MDVIDSLLLLTMTSSLVEDVEIDSIQFDTNRWSLCAYFLLSLEKVHFNFY